MSNMQHVSLASWCRKDRWLITLTASKLFLFYGYVLTDLFTDQKGEETNLFREIPRLRTKENKRTNKQKNNTNKKKGNIEASKHSSDRGDLLLYL